MATTILGPSLQPYPRPVYAPVIQLKPTWSADWLWWPELELVAMDWHVAGQGLSKCEFRRRYGVIKHPWESSYGPRVAWGPGDGWWVRVGLAGPAGYLPQWIGQVSGNECQPLGPGGRETWVAYGPIQILRKIHVAHSWWEIGGQRERMGWLPKINDRDQRHQLQGNRSTSPLDGSYLYGGTEVWTHRQYLEYLLARWVDESASGGPSWTLGGQAELLEDLQDSIDLGVSKPVEKILQELIPARYGLGWTILANDAGFEIAVYALSSLEFSFAGATLPKNPQTVSIAAGQTLDAPTAQLVQTSEHGYGRLRIVGKRIVVCATLYGSGLADAAYPGGLVRKWTNALQTSYYAGAGPDAEDPKEHDDARGQEKFRPVFQFYGAPEDDGISPDWDFNQHDAAPYLDADGELSYELYAPTQARIRRTLSWTPLQEGMDYSQNPPADHNPPDHLAEFRPPSVWIGIKGLWAADPEGVGFLPAEEAHLGISAPRNDWGVHLSVSPNHLLAKEHWPGSAADTEHLPLYDYELMAATIAFESDRRLELMVEVPGAKPSDGELVIEVDDAEYWYLAPNTMLGCDERGKMITSGPDPRILRNDVERLGLVMAGAIARYVTGRTRAQIPIKGLLPYAGLVGQILEYVQAGTIGQWLGSPITSISWRGGAHPETILHTGFAG